MASVVVVATGAALAVTIPFVALKEMIEKRHRLNMKKHLGGRRACRVNFGSVDDIYAEEYKKKMAWKPKTASIDPYSSDDDDRASVMSSPPNYDDLVQPPPYPITTITPVKPQP